MSIEKLKEIEKIVNDGEEIILKVMTISIYQEVRGMDMGLKYLDIDKKYIENLFATIIVEEFTRMVENKLNIEHNKYFTSIKDIAQDSERFMECNIHGRIKYSDSYTEVISIEYYAESMAEYIKRRFGKLAYDKDIIKVIAYTIIKKTIAHEIRHIWQFENGQITYDIIQRERSKPYSDKNYEIDAIQFSEDIISEIGEFEKRILKVIQNKEQICNDNIKEYVNLFKKE